MRVTQKGSRMSALPTPGPPERRKNSRKESLRTIARLLEEQMDELGLSESEKNARVDALVEDVKKVKASRGAIPAK